MEIEMLDDAPEVREEPTAIQQTSIALVQGALVEFDKVEYGLADLKARFGNVIYDVGTTAGMAAAKAARLEIRGPRYAVDKVLKATKEPLNAIKKELDDRAGQITAALLEIETPIHEQIKAEEDRKAAEKAERERVAAEKKLAVDNAMTWIRNHTIQAVGKSSADIADLLKSLETMEVTLEALGDRAGEAEQCRLMTIDILDGMHAAVFAQEAAAAEFEAQRIRLEAERAEQERIAREAAEKAEAEPAEKRRAFQQEQADARARQEAAARQEEEARQALAAERAAFEAEKAEKLASEQKALEPAAGIGELVANQEQPNADRSSSAIDTVAEMLADDSVEVIPASFMAAAAEELSGDVAYVAITEVTPVDPSDADVIFTAARAVSLEYGMTIGEAIHRLAAVESWAQIEAGEAA